MRYMLRATEEALAGFQTIELDEIMDVVDFGAEPPVVADGPYGEAKELFGGFWIVDVASREEAVEWAKRAPMTRPRMKTEIRRVTSIDDDLLTLMLIACHPVPTREAQVALTLRVLRGLTSDEIARCFMVPDDSEVQGLRALLEPTSARFPARVGAEGEPVLLYEALGRLAPSPVVGLNRAVAISLARGPAAALPVVDELVAAASLSTSHLLPSVRGGLLSRLGRTDEAGRELERGLLESKVVALHLLEVSGR